MEHHAVPQMCELGAGVSSNVLLMLRVGVYMRSLYSVSGVFKRSKFHNIWYQLAYQGQVCCLIYKARCRHILRFFLLYFWSYTSI